MLAWIARGLATGRVTTALPAPSPEPAPHGFRGRSRCSSSAAAPARARRGAARPGRSPSTPRAAHARSRPLHPLRRMRARGAGPLRLRGALRDRRAITRAARRRAATPIDAAVGAAAAARSATRRGALRRSIHVRHIDCGSDGAEEWEIQALWNPYYDIQRLGFFLTAAPRHADVLLVTGAGDRADARAAGAHLGGDAGAQGAGRRRHRRLLGRARARSPRCAAPPLAASTRCYRSTSTCRARRRRRSRSCTGCCWPPACCRRRGGGDDRRVRARRWARCARRYRSPSRPRALGARVCAAAGCVGLVVVGLDGSARRAIRPVLSLGSWLGFGHSALRADGLAGIFLALTGLTGAAVSLAYAERPAARWLTRSPARCCCSWPSRSAPTTASCSSSPGRRSRSAST